MSPTHRAELMLYFYPILASKLDLFKISPTSVRYGDFADDAICRPLANLVTT